MRHPLEFVPLARRRPLFFAFLALTLILFAVFRVLDQPLRTVAAPNGIVSFELAGDALTARAITDSWKQTSLLLSSVAGQSSPDLVNVPYVFAAFGLGLDYLFMPLYALALAFGTLLAAGRQGGWMQYLGAAAGYSALGAALFDAVENYALMRVLLGIVDSGEPALASFCAIVKFGLITFSLLYAVLAGGLPARSHP